MTTARIKDGATVKQFRDAWSEEAELGTVDGLGGSQYRRAFRAWTDAGRPPNAPVWIRLWAYNDALNGPH